jgi:hypothetical protein
VVFRLVDEAGRAQLAEELSGAGGEVGGVVRDPGIERLARADGVRDGAHRLLDRRVRVGAVRIKDIDVVEAEALQALVERRQEILA